RLSEKTYGPAEMIGGSGPNDVWVGVNSWDYLLHYDGKGWRRVTVSFGHNAKGFWRASNGETWAVAANGPGDLWRWDGTAWWTAASCTASPSAIAGGGSQPVLVADGQIRVPDRDWEWQPVFAFRGKSPWQAVAWEQRGETDPIGGRLPYLDAGIVEPHFVS